jgi:hypothetical protein
VSPSNCVHIVHLPRELASLSHTIPLSLWMVGSFCNCLFHGLVATAWNGKKSPGASGELGMQAYCHQQQDCLESCRSKTGQTESSSLKGTVTQVRTDSRREKAFQQFNYSLLNSCILNLDKQNLYKLHRKFTSYFMPKTFGHCAPDLPRILEILETCWTMPN